MVDKLSFAPGCRSRTLFVIFNSIFFILVCLIILVPIAKVLADSFDEKAALTVFRMFPARPTVDAYKMILTRKFLYRPFLISLLTTVSGTLLSMVLTTLFAYALSQKELPGRRIFMFMAMITMVFRAGLIPVFLVVRSLGLMNSLLAVILVHAMDAYYVILLKNFFSSIPKSLVEAAEMDGCKPFNVFIKIILPLSKAGLSAVGLFYIVQYWNQFFDYIIYINDNKWHNFQVVLRSMVIESDTSGYEGFSFATESLKNAVVVISIIPVIILYPFIQKYFVKGIRLGAIKE